MIFDFKKAEIYKAVLLYRIFPGGILKFYRVLLLVLGLVPVILFFVNQAYNLEVQISLGWTLAVLPFAASVIFFELFAGYYLKFPKIRSTDNIADLIEFEAARVFDRAFELSRALGEKELSIKTLLVAMIEDRVMEKLFTRIMPNFISIRKNLKDSVAISTPFSERFSLFTSSKISSEVMLLLEDSLKLRDKHGSNRVSVLDIMAAMFDHSDEFKRFILGQDLDRNDLEELAKWYEHIWAFWREMKKFWSLDNQLRKPPIGRDWIYGYARHLTNFSVSLSDKVEFKKPSLKLVTRQKEINQIEQILSRSGENNILLVGDEGVGKDSIILDFTELIVKGRALPSLNYKKVLELNLSLVTGASKDISSVQNILLAVLNEAKRAGNIILVIKDLHNFIGEIGGLGRIDVSELLLPYLRSASLQVIATTSPANFHKFIEPRSELTKVFERINVVEPDAQQTVEILQEAIPAIESRSRVLVTYGAIKEIVSGADKFIRSSPFPEKAFDLLSEVVSSALAEKSRIITKDHVDGVISRKTGVPLGPIAGEEKDKLIRLEEIMHKELVGQDRAVEVVSSTMRRLRTGLGKRDKPAGVFLFIGPTGVGKTLTAKILAKIYFGSSDRMLRFDMSEYQRADSLDRFLGSTRTQEPGQFVTAVRDNPFSLILLDEIEKADKNILNLFLQVFDEGRLTDVFGRKINFEQNIIIATSNAGFELIRELVKQGLDPSLEKEKIIDTLIQGGYFRPELLNRFDEIVVFHPLSQDQVSLIAGLLLDALTVRLKDRGYEFKSTAEIAEFISKVGFDPQFGARPMDRVIRDKVEGAIAKKILNGEIKKGVPFSLALADLN